MVQERINRETGYLKESQEVLEELQNKDTQNSSKVRKKIGKLANAIDPEHFPDPTYFLGKEIQIPYSAAESIAEDSKPELMKIVNENFGESLNLVTGDNLETVVLNVMPSEIGNANHDEKAREHREYMILANLIHKGDLRPYLEGFRQNMRAFMTIEARRNPEEIGRMANEYVNIRKEKFTAKFKDNEGNYKERKTRKYITENYNREDENHQHRTELMIGLSAAA